MDPEIQALLTGKHDQDNAVMTIHAGFHDAEAANTALLLNWAYIKWAEQQGFTPGTLRCAKTRGGIAQARLLIEGPWAYGLLASEKGTHSLVHPNPKRPESPVGALISTVAIDVVPVSKDELERADEVPHLSISETLTVVRKYRFVYPNEIKDPRTRARIKMPGTFDTFLNDIFTNLVDLNPFIEAGVRWRHEQQS